jgi:multidrug transporter EmrE-like cation transporter
MTYLLLGLILLTVTLSACAQLASKLGVAAPRLEQAFRGTIPDALIAAMTSPLIWIGLAIYAASVAMWLWVLSNVGLSAAYRFVGASFLVIMAFGALLLNESVTPMRIVETVLIATGSVFVAFSA